MFEIDYLKNKNTSSFIIGLDEVGRGPLVGPVVAGGCLVEFKSLEDLKKMGLFLNELGINDSKKLSSKKRCKIISAFEIDIENIAFKQKLRLITQNNLKLSVILTQKSALEIDRINILNASLKAMKEACLLLKRPDFGTVLVDGCHIPKNLASKNLAVHPIVKGDSKSVFIALASIFAKEKRDLIMTKYAKKYPFYQFEKNSGYPTLAHRQALLKFGPTPMHRKSYKGVKELL